MVKSETGEKRKLLEKLAVIAEKGKRTGKDRKR